MFSFERAQINACNGKTIGSNLKEVSSANSFLCRHDFFVLRDVNSQRVYLQEESLPLLLSELSAWPLFIS